MQQHNYFVYIITNPHRTAVYVGVTNDLARRIQEHFKNRGNPGSFAGKYHCYDLVYYERYSHINNAIAREKEIKGWKREKKDALINEENPEWLSLNKGIFE